MSKLFDCFRMIVHRHQHTVSAGDSTDLDLETIISELGDLRRFLAAHDAAAAARDTKGLPILTGLLRAAADRIEELRTDRKTHPLQSPGNRVNFGTAKFKL